MAKFPAFMTAFRLTAKAAIHTPLVFRAGLFSGDGLHWKVLGISRISPESKTGRSAPPFPGQSAKGR